MRLSDAPPGNYISQVSVEQLYGEFNYEIGPVKDGADPRIFILYGNNGTGKTTILQLLRSLLSPSNSAGHRSRLAAIPFKKVEVFFLDGRKISATRERDLVGSYLLSISGGGEGAGSKVFMKAEPDLSIRTTTWSRGEQIVFQKFLEHLEKVSKEVSFLDDKRTFTRGELSDRTRMRARRNMVHEGYLTPILDDETEDPVSASVSMLVESIRREALVRQRRGSGDSQYIYRNLIDALARGTTVTPPSITDLSWRLAQTERLSKELSNIGLTSPLKHADMVDQISQVSDDRREVLTDLIAAYVKSTEAWFSALKELKGLLDKFVDHLNSFIYPKSASFTVNDGLVFYSKGKKPLSLLALSSGERHLVMMLTQALLRRNETGLVVIDEPELSLNIKWQRELVGAILDCLGGGASQVVFATHSIEIAARYRKNVVRLWASGEVGDEAND